MIMVGAIAARRRSSSSGGGGGSDSEVPFSAVQLLVNAEIDVSPSIDFFDVSSFLKPITRNSVDTYRDAAVAVYGNYGITMGAAAGRVDWIAGAVADWKFLHDGTDKWTIDFQWDPANISTLQCLFDTGGGTSANAGIFMDISAARVPTFQIYNASGNINTCPLNGTFQALANDTNPRHIRLSYDPDPVGSPSENAKLWERGIWKGAIQRKTNIAPSSANPAFALRFGGFGSSGLEPSRCSMDEIRVVKGYALDGTNQSSAWPTS